MKLATKISFLLVGVLLLAVLSSVAMLLSSSQSSRLMQNMVAENLASVRAAEELEVALLEQRGFVSAYILDKGNRSWLEELGRRKPIFAHWLERARQTAITAEEQQILAELAQVFQEYDSRRDQVIALHEAGNLEEATNILLRDMIASYNQAYGLCEKLIAANERLIDRRIAAGNRQLRRNTLLAGAYTTLIIALSLGLFWVFFHGILRPLRQMASQARIVAPLSPGADSPQDELRALGLYLGRLMSDVAETRSDLERSRDRLLNAEKLASVGKLAASVAHEIRNPLTSVKMRLFSLRRDLGHDPQHQDDLGVVSEEIARLESIIRNFLEFARPPDLRLQAHDLSLLLDKTLELCGHRLVEKDIVLERQDAQNLPPVLADAEQLRQVFLNLLLNAVEAMQEGGYLHIASTLEQDGEGHPMAVVRFADSGAGIPEDVRPRVFEPFFTTKETGTGLGLCIAASIMVCHQGRLELESTSDQGTTFAVWLPIYREKQNG